MKNTYVNVTGKLPAGLTALYTDIHKHTRELSIEFLVVGAMARDIVLVHGFGLKVERGTKDVDFGINVESWFEFNTLRDRLLQAGYIQDLSKVHRLIHRDEDDVPWEIDIIPFGNVSDENKQIYWPPKNDVVMNVNGFKEAFEHALNVKISEVPDITIPVASPAGFCLLKLVSWLDREREMRAKDATDLIYLIQNYSKIPGVRDTLYEEGYMDAQEWDEELASTMKLGEDVAVIASLETTKVLKDKLFNNSENMDQIARDMEGLYWLSLPRCRQMLNVFANSYLRIQLG